MPHEGRPNAATEERFWAKVDRSGGPDACWPWSAYRTPRGYGRFRIGHDVFLAHRVSYQLSAGEIQGETLDHLCFNPACCNPAHLIEATKSANSQRLQRTLKSHCINGHPFDDANTYVERKGSLKSRNCRACNRERVRAYKKRRRLTRH